MSEKTLPMPKALDRRKNLLFFYFAFVLMAAILLFLRNPVSFVREDLWGEDGRDYIAGVINHGFWQTLYLNFVQKGYLQFFKVFIAALGLGINQIFFNGEILFLPRIIAVMSYLIYACIFCLPILLFHSKIEVKYLVAIAISTCLVDLGPMDSFLVFGRILNVGFLSIYFCFLLVGYRILFIDKIRNCTLYLIDFLIFLCIITQPINVFLFVFIFIDYLAKILFILFKIGINITSFKPISKNSIISLFILCIGTIIYFLSILIIDLKPKTYATVYGNPPNMEYSYKLFFGKLWFNQLLAPIYARLPESLIVFFLFVLVVFTLISREKLLIYCLYSLISISWMTVYWRPGLLVAMKNVESLRVTVYTMASNLIFIFMTFVMLADLIERFSSFKIAKLKINNILICSLVGLYIATGWHSIKTANFQPTISLKQGLCMAKASGSNREDGLVQVPANPTRDMDMLLPKRLIECKVK
ncbi:hypothetical protein Ple7327_4333 [Pleurocapsa sp. PCC 7327]|uniref:hypothetical protein n=1 Tax=Pleurocapsa sp. PCC 7327 TaxID=118163 RepID=UPI00029F950D|nr:hypothetical protein [Pleurocapsa sp. PCC 7327]AFY79444.1 hypothetical protein Ple7327_4333 [Pleurocapsa sp. PCC 7327]